MSLTLMDSKILCEEIPQVVAQVGVMLPQTEFGPDVTAFVVMAGPFYILSDFLSFKADRVETAIFDFMLCQSLRFKVTDEIRMCRRESHPGSIEKHVPVRDEAVKFMAGDSVCLLVAGYGGGEEPVQKFETVIQDSHALAVGRRV